MGTLEDRNPAPRTARTNSPTVSVTAVKVASRETDFQAGPRARDDDLDRRIEDLRKLFGETYTRRDALKAMQERLDRIEMGRAQVRSVDAPR